MEQRTAARRGSTAATDRVDSGNHHRGEERKGRSPAQLYCLLFGTVLIIAGIAGFFTENGTEFGLPDSLRPGDSELLSLFDINGWHNLVHIATGALLLLASPKAALARTVALVFGLAYVAVTIIGLIDTEDVLGLIPINGADNILHAALAITAILAALMPRSKVPADESKPALA